METLGYIIYLFLLVGSLLSLASAQPQPFSQCIEVVNLSSGIGLSGLSCSFTDSVFSSSMSDSGNGFYCVQISDHVAGSYSFTSVCSDGSVNKTIFGSFEIEEVYSGSPIPFEPQFVTKKENPFVYSLKYLKNNPIIFISVIASLVAVILYVNRRKR